MKKYLFMSMLLFLFIGCSTLRVQTDYDEKFNFKSFSKFAVIHSNKSDGKDFTRGKIARVLSNNFKAKGYSSSAKNEADFYVLFHLDIQKKSQVETNYETMGLYPPVRIYRHKIVPGRTHPAYILDPYISPFNATTTRVTTQTYEYEEGHLLVELIDAKSNSVVWQGTAVDELSELSTKEERSAYINMVVDSLLKEFPKK